MVSSTTIIIGVSASAILTTGYLTAIGCLIRAPKQKTAILYWAALFLFCMGSFYLGTVSSFISLLLTGENLPEHLVGQLCYLWSPIGVASAVYVGFKIIKPKLAKPFAFVYIISGVLYWFGLFFMPSVNISSEIPEEGKGLIDIKLTGFVEVMTVVYLVSFVIIMLSGFIWLRANSSGIVRKKATYHIIGYALFFVCGFIDSGVEFTIPIYILIVRLFMITAYIFMYLGYTKSG